MVGSLGKKRKESVGEERKEKEKKEICFSHFGRKFNRRKEIFFLLKVEKKGKEKNDTAFFIFR